MPLYARFVVLRKRRFVDMNFYISLHGIKSITKVVKYPPVLKVEDVKIKISNKYKTVLSPFMCVLWFHEQSLH